MPIHPFTSRPLVSRAFQRLDQRPLDYRRRSGRVKLRFLLEPLEDRRLLSGISSITEFSTPSPGGPNTWDITAGPDGNLWFTESITNKIGIINPTTHVITELNIPTASAEPRGITSGPDGNVWFTEHTVGKIGMVNPTTHVITEFATKKANSAPQEITAGPDGNIWFTESGTNKLAKLNPTTHAITEFAVPTANAEPYALTFAPDGNLWFTEHLANQFAMMDTTTHVITEFPVPTGSGWQVITKGPDGNLWLGGGWITKINPTTHATTQYKTLNGVSGITTGPDGNIWFTEGAYIRPEIIGRIDPATGVVTEYPAAPPTYHLYGLTTGPDGNLWFTDSQPSKVGVATLSSNEFVVSQQPPSNLPAGSSFGLTVQAVDVLGNLLTSFNDKVTVALADATNNLSNPVIGGTITTTAINGVATFAGITLPTTAGFYYYLSVSGGGFGWGETSKITVVAGAASSIRVFQAPPSKVGVNQTFSFQAGLNDQYGNPVTTSGGTLSVALASNPTGAILSGALNASVVQGVATFSGLNISKVGTGYTLQVTGGGLTSTITTAIEVTKKAQAGVAASAVTSLTAVSTNTLVVDSPGLWDGLGRKKRASDL